MINGRFPSCAYKLLVGFYALAMAAPAYAYIDPVTGSFVVQGLIAGVLAVVGGICSIRQRLFGLFKRRRDDDAS